MHKHIFAAMQVLSSTGYTIAEDYRFTGEELDAFSPLMAGTFGAVNCDILIDEDAAANFIKARLGKNASLSPEGMAHIIWLAYAQAASQALLGVFLNQKRI